MLIATWNRDNGVNLNNFQLKTINFYDRRARYHAILCEKRKYIFYILAVLCLYRNYILKLFITFSGFLY